MTKINSILESASKAFCSDEIPMFAIAKMHKLTEKALQAEVDMQKHYAQQLQALANAYANAHNDHDSDDLMNLITQLTSKMGLSNENDCNSCSK